MAKDVSTPRVTERNKALNEKAKAKGWKHYSEYSTAIINGFMEIPVKIDYLTRNAEADTKLSGDIRAWSEDQRAREESAQTDGNAGGEYITGVDPAQAGADHTVTGFLGPSSIYLLDPEIISGRITLDPAYSDGRMMEVSITKKDLQKIARYVNVENKNRDPEDATGLPEGRNNTPGE